MTKLDFECLGSVLHIVKATKLIFVDLFFSDALEPKKVAFNPSPSHADASDDR